MYNIKFDDYEKPKYISIGSFHEGLAIVVNNDELYGYIDKNGDEVIPCQFVSADDFHEGMAVIRENSLDGYIDKSGKTVISPTWRKAHPFCNGLALVRQGNGQYVYISKEGTIVSEEYYNATDFHEGFGIIKKNMSSAKEYFDGKVEHSIDDSELRLFSEGVTLTATSPSYTLRDKNLNPIKTITSTGISHIAPRSCGMHKVETYNRRVGYMNEELELVIPYLYEAGEDFHDDVAIVQLVDEVIGILSKDGMVTAFMRRGQYEEISSFSEGLARVKQYSTHKYGFINKKGKIVIPCVYKDADSFSEGLAGVFDDDGFGYFLNHRGKKVLTLPKLYCTETEFGGQKYTLEADSEEELRNKKLALLAQFRTQVVNDITAAVEEATRNLLPSKKHVNTPVTKNEQ